MSLIDGLIGNRRNTWLQVRLTPEENKTLEHMAASFDMEKSELVRQKLFGRAIDYVKSEISNAIEKVRNGYHNMARAPRNYFSDPEDAYSAPYIQDNYGFSPVYR